jgi:hypothetical protein
MGRTVITPDKIKEINERYKALGTYAAVSRELNISPSTVRKYVIKTEVVNNEKVEIIRFNKKDLPDFDVTTYRNIVDLGRLCKLSDSEKEEIQGLWKELSL